MAAERPDHRASALNSSGELNRGPAVEDENEGLRIGTEAP